MSTITVYIGNDSSLDGGPFQNDVIISHTEDEIKTTTSRAYDKVSFPRYVLTELAEQLPVEGGYIEGVPKEESFMRVDVECDDAVLFETNGMAASGDELEQSGDLRRRFTRSFKNHGGDVSENY